jgi:cell wall-associated NlpC family hydrolase
MRTNKTKLFLGFFIFFFAAQFQAQNIRLDRLEQLFDQGYFKLVHRKSKQLLNDPSYDYSLLPSYYKAISTLELAQRANWKARHQEEFTWATTFLLKLKTQRKGQQLMSAHRNELKALQDDLAHHISTLTGAKNQAEKEVWQHFTSQFFADIELPVQPNGLLPNYSEQALQLKSQQAIINEAQKHLGVAYLTAGSDPAGFDCSGFTSYVFAKAGYSLPRRAADQFAEIQKIEANEAQLGDLVFFSNGGEVNHVGILISEKGSAKQMIHASSSKGISIADIEATNYWKTRVVGYGRVINP